MDRVKRLSHEVLKTHRSKFSEDFADNKKALGQVSIIRSKSLKNEIAGFITKSIKRDIREAEDRQKRLEEQANALKEAEESQAPAPETPDETASAPSGEPEGAEPSPQE